MSNFFELKNKLVVKGKSNNIFVDLTHFIMFSFPMSIYMVPRMQVDTPKRLSLARHHTIPCLEDYSILANNTLS